MFSSKTRKGLAALIAIVGLLAVSVGAAGAAGPDLDMRYGPAGVDSDDGYYWDYYPLPPWQHNVVIVDANRGSDQHDPDGPAWFDPNLAVPSLEEYANGHKQYLVDQIISIGPDGYGQGDPITGQGMGAGGEYENPYGDIAVALQSAGSFCNNDWWSACDIVLVTYQAPESLDHQRHAMAEAMRLAADGHRLHTVAIGDPTASGEEILANSHYNFSALLGVNGWHAISNADRAADSIQYMIEQRFRYNEYVVEPEPWPEPPSEVECEIYDPDGNCYYGEDVPEDCWDCDYPVEEEWYEDAAAEEPDPFDGLYWELFEYALNQICNYPGLDDLATEIGEYVEWAVEDMLRYLETNYPDLDIGSEDRDELAQLIPADEDWIDEICSEPLTPEPPVEPTTRDTDV